MEDVQALIETLLLRRPRGFRNKHFAEAVGLSRSRASRLLARLVLSGELTRLGEGRGPYVHGPYYGTTAAGIARGALPKGFWSALVEDYPDVVYVALHRLGLTEVRTRQQLRTALHGLLDNPKRYLIVDFEGVRALSDAAACELLFKIRREFYARVEPINLEPAVARTVWRVLRFGD
jgi:hypothetical protein